MKSAALIASALIGSAAAFAPAQTGKATTALHAFESELGAQPPLGFWDPLGMLDGADQERFDRLRYVEVKHGRIAQLAFLGQIVTRNGQHFDGPIDKAGDAYSSFPNGLAAILGDNAIPKEGVQQILIFIGILEVTLMSDWTESAEFPGDLRNGTFEGAWNKWNDKQKLQKRAVELNNGRAAMMGILGLMMHEQIGGSFPIIGQM
eukprot:CAMPEP_0196131778 /NCGR_PEP_ID=MMETSP0910-20130528/1641_1 /TAXON_ID=49265 /ORGANISM="Thalassiosira rotula, Strain GSO102" /LENGTH=204 /DNA_ID=CAMNT_0041391287 /DNA_START=78 /DNA_END=692 /DNA_ORIENTATION=+